MSDDNDDVMLCHVSTETIEATVQVLARRIQTLRRERDEAVRRRNGFWSNYADEHRRLSEVLGILSEFLPHGADIREALEALVQRAGKAEAALAEREAECERLKRQLPDGMKHCTIVFRECDKGHGWLTATNWIDHPCPTCRSEKAEAELALVDKALAPLAAAPSRYAAISWACANANRGSEADYLQKRLDEMTVRVATADKADEPPGCRRSISYPGAPCRILFCPARWPDNASEWCEFCRAAVRP